jgi:hypothetical protein
MTMPPFENLTTVGGLRALLIGEQAAWLTKDTRVAVEDTNGVVRRISGFARREMQGVETMVLTIREVFEP